MKEQWHGHDLVAGKALHFPKDFRRAVVNRIVRGDNSTFDIRLSCREAPEFFGEFIDLESLPSQDSRYDNAAQDIYMHTVFNNDYELEDLLSDARFDPTLYTDEQFKTFIETSLRHDFQQGSAGPLAKFVTPMFRSIGMDVVPKLEFGIEVGYQIVSGKVDATNQGRAHSANPAPIEYKGLHFRSQVEVEFFKSLYAADYLVAPLPVFLHRPTFRRVEPDFVLVKYGIWAIVEIDGKVWHRESPVEAAKRLDPFTDEDVRIIRFSDEDLSTPEGRDKAVETIMSKFENWRKIR